MTALKIIFATFHAITLSYNCDFTISYGLNFFFLLYNINVSLQSAISNTGFGISRTSIVVKESISSDVFTI